MIVKNREVAIERRVGAILDDGERSVYVGVLVSMVIEAAPAPSKSIWLKRSLTVRVALIGADKILLKLQRYDLAFRRGWGPEHKLIRASG